MYVLPFGQMSLWGYLKLAPHVYLLFSNYITLEECQDILFHLLPATLRGYEQREGNLITSLISNINYTNQDLQNKDVGTFTFPSIAIDPFLFHSLYSQLFHKYEIMATKYINIFTCSAGKRQRKSALQGTTLVVQWQAMASLPCFFFRQPLLLQRQQWKQRGFCCLASASASASASAELSSAEHFP